MKKSLQKIENENENVTKEIKDKSYLIINARKSYPFTLDQYIGHKSIVTDLKLLVSNYKKFGSPIGHLLFFGIGGLGKTTLTEILSDTVGNGLIATLGETIKKPTDVYNICEKIEEGVILFIDEIHKVLPYETFHSVMQDFFLDTPDGRCNIPIFTLIGATTEPHLLTKPFLQRFNYKFYLEPYTELDIAKVLSLCCKDNFIQGITKKAAFLLAHISQGIMRIARNEMLVACRDIAINENIVIIDSKIVNTVIQRKGIHGESGLNRLQLLTLKVLNDNIKTPMGVKNISELLRVSPNYFSEDIEHSLIFGDFIKRTSRGRLLTKKGEELINKVG